MMLHIHIMAKIPLLELSRTPQKGEKNSKKKTSKRASLDEYDIICQKKKLPASKPKKNPVESSFFINQKKKKKKKLLDSHSFTLALTKTSPFAPSCWAKRCVPARPPETFAGRWAVFGGTFSLWCLSGFKKRWERLVCGFFLGFLLGFS